MKFASQNLQPFQLDVVTIARTGQAVNAKLGNESSPFKIHRDSVPVLIKTGDYNARYRRSSRYIEATMPLSKADLETLYRMVSATDLGYQLLLSLPLLNISWTVSAEVLTAILTANDETYYTLSFYDTPTYIGWWQRILNKFSRKGEPHAN